MEDACVTIGWTSGRSAAQVARLVRTESRLYSEADYGAPDAGTSRYEVTVRVRPVGYGPPAIRTPVSTMGSCAPAYLNAANIGKLVLVRKKAFEKEFVRRRLMNCNGDGTITFSTETVLRLVSEELVSGMAEDFDFVFLE